MSNMSRKAIKLAIILAMVVVGLWFMRETVLEKGIVAAKAGHYIEAIQYVKPLGYLGDSSAQRLMGDFYAFGWGVTKDDAEAVRWYDKLGTQKSAESQFYAGERYEEGLGVKQDNVQATNWFNRSAERGFERAREKLKKKSESK